MAESPSEALRRRSEALIVIVGYPESGWSVTARVGLSERLLLSSGPTIDEACAEMLALLDTAAPPKRKLVRKR